jgi:protein-tyrosine phosphatase
MVDIHSHVLWGMDDGAKTEEMSLEMLRIAAEAGTTVIVGTPHSNGEFFYQPELIDERIRQLNEKTGSKPHILRGCDLHLSFDNIMEALQNPSKYSINGKQYILVECSDLHIAGSMDRVLDQLLAVDLVPIVTHPERNPILQKEPNRLEKWVELGCLVQVTAGSVMGGFGKRAHAAAQSLLSKGMVHVIASDAHDPEYRHPRLDEAYAAIAGEYGEEIAELLFRENPGRIVEGKYVSPDPFPTAAKRKWWQFWGGGEARESRGRD